MIVDRISPLVQLPPVEVLRSGIPSGSPLARAVIALGNFDGFHRGHRLLIGRAQQRAAGRLPVAVMSVEPHPRQFFSPQTPVQRLALPPQKHRTARILGLDYVFEPHFDHAFAALSPEAFITDILHERLDISHVVVGEDFRFGAGRKGDCSMLVKVAEQVGIGVEIVPLQDDFSSSVIRAALSNGDLKTAERCLGRFWEAEVTRAEDCHCLAAGLIRPAEGYYSLANPANGQTFQARLTDDGRIEASADCPKRVIFLRRQS